MTAKILLLSVLLWTVICAPAKSFSSKFTDVVDSVWDEFWDDGYGSWNSVDKCVGGFKYPAVWDQAVAGKAIAETLDTERLTKVVGSLKQYLNGDNWFSSSTAKDNDVYIDDNAQILWVLVDAYKYAGSIEDLTLAEKLMDNIMGQEIEGGGVRWKLNADYVASISTGEAALAAIRLHQETNNQDLLEFAERNIDWIFDNLQDSSDGLIWDGLKESNGEIDKGKLTYSVGTMISTLAYLAQETKDDKYYDKAVKLADSALNPKGAFYNGNGYWNNGVKYSHLLFMGISDLITVYTATNSKQSGVYQKYIGELNSQAKNIYDVSQVSANNFVGNIDGAQKFKDDSGNYCDGKPKESLLDNMSVGQIFYAMSRIGA